MGIGPFLMEIGTGCIVLGVVFFVLAVLGYILHTVLEKINE